MNITNYQDLESQGISLEQIKTSLEVTCFGKKFSRHLHVPKSFQSKITNLAEELAKQKVSYFITETNFSYTLWREKKAIKPAIPSKIQMQTTANSHLANLANKPEQLIEVEQKINHSSLPKLADSPHSLNENEPHFLSQLVVNDNQKLDQQGSKRLTTVEDDKENRFSVSEPVVVNNRDSSPSLSDINTQPQESIKYRGVTSTTNNKQKVNLPRKKRVITYRGVSREI